MKKLFTLLLVLIACSVSAIDMGPYDTGAARKSDLGTMAAEAATDYVATDTFTGHTGATGASVHGLGTISTKAATDYVATSALALRLDTVNASFTGDIDVAGNVLIATSTDDGTNKLQVNGGIVSTRFPQNTNNDATPSVADTNFLYLTNYTAPTTITALDDGVTGQIVTLFINSAHEMTLSNAGFLFSVDADFVVVAGAPATITFVRLNTSWVEISRSQRLY